MFGAINNRTFVRKSEHLSIPKRPGAWRNAKKIFKKSIDKSLNVWYNVDNEREVISMFLVVWKYIDEDKVQGSVMTSRELMFLRLDPNVRVKKIEEV